MIQYVELSEIQKAFDEVDYVLFTSPSTVNNMVDMVGIDEVKKKKINSYRSTNGKSLRVKVFGMLYMQETF